MTSGSATLLVALPEQTVVRLLGLRRSSGECLPDVIDRLATSERSHRSRTDGTCIKPRDSLDRYMVRILGESFTGGTIGDVLATTLSLLADLDPTILDRLEKLGGRTRRHVARTPDAVHSGRPDLNRRCTREIRQGWWIGTNYSRRDACRIIRDTCRVSGLQYGRDIELIAD